MAIGTDPELALRIVRESPLIAYDTETTGLEIKDIPCGYVITDADNSIYVAVRHELGGNISENPDDIMRFEAELNRAFADRARRGYHTVGHYLAFDIEMSAKMGIIVDGSLEDTQINETLIYDIAPSLSLDECAKRYDVTHKMGSALYLAMAKQFGGMADRSQMKNFWRMSANNPLVIEYAAGDGVTTYELRQAQQRLLDDADLRRVWQLECALIPRLALMKRRGIRIDMAKSEIIEQQTKNAILEALKAFPPGFNVLSPKDMESYFRSRGVNEFKKTAGGRPSFTERVLEGSEDGRAVLKIRQLRKSLSSFITPLVSTYNVKGRVHPTLVQSKSEEFGAGGGRLSCVDPNMQAFPKRNKPVGIIVRQLVIPDDGMELSESDFQQQEPHLFAHYSGDRNLMAGYLADPPIDIHTMAARITGWDRERAKRIGLAILTGLGQSALAEHLGVSLADGISAHKEYLSAFPGIKKFQKDAKATMVHRGYVLTLLGRRCTVENNSFAYKAVSRIIQGGGADHTKTALLAACEYCESESEHINLLMTIHDSFISQHTERKYRDELIRILDSIAPKLGILVPIPTETGTGKNWSEASYGGKS